MEMKKFRKTLALILAVSSMAMVNLTATFAAANSEANLPTSSASADQEDEIAPILLKCNHKVHSLIRTKTFREKCDLGGMHTVTAKTYSCECGQSQYQKLNSPCGCYHNTDANSLD